MQLPSISGPPKAPAAAPPNVVVIQTDDQTLSDLYATYTDPLTGAVTSVMPNTLSLIASQGITFNKYYVSNPLCCPSRTTMLTGRYSHNNGVVTNFFPSGGYYKFDQQNNLAVWLHNRGYKTSHVGKFLNQYGDNDPTEIPQGWSDWHTVIGDARLFYGYTTNDNGVVSDPHGAYDDATKSYPEKDPASCPDNPPPLQECNYLTDVITQDALDAVNKYSAEPFYLQVDYTTPHGDIALPGGPEPATRDAGTFPGAKLPRLPNFNEFDMSDKPAFVRSNPKLGFGKIDYIDRRYEQRLEALRAVDSGIGKIVNRLDGGGLLGNTYVIFVSDNGFFGGEHRFDSAKFLAYEPSNHLPLLIRGPGHRSGHQDRRAGRERRPRADDPAVDRRQRDRGHGRTLTGPLLHRPGKADQAPILLEGFTGKGEAGTTLRPSLMSKATASIKASPRDYEGVRNRPLQVHPVPQRREGALRLQERSYELHSRRRPPLPPGQALAQRRAAPDGVLRRSDVPPPGAGQDPGAGPQAQAEAQEAPGQASGTATRSGLTCGAASCAPS